MNGSGGNVAGCATCFGRCCREYRVEITAADMRRLAAGTNLHPREFVWLRDSETKDNGFHLTPGGNGLELHLIRNQMTGACVFLMEIAPNLARCGVYVDRPYICRNFPTQLERGVVGVRPDVKCGPDSWNLAAMDVATYRRDLVRSGAAWHEHWQLVRGWNAKVDAGTQEYTPDQLYDHLLNHVLAPV